MIVKEDLIEVVEEEVVEVEEVEVVKEVIDCLMMTDYFTSFYISNKLLNGKCSVLLEGSIVRKLRSSNC